MTTNINKHIYSMAFLFTFLTLVLYIVPHNIIGMQQLASGSIKDTLKELANNNDDQSTSGNNSEDKEKNSIGTSGNDGFTGNNDLDEKD